MIQNRYFAGPSWCPLCKDGEENPNHLFLSCPFSIQVWQHSKAMTPQNYSWTGPSIEEAWRNWSTNPQLAHAKALPLLHLRGIWVARNLAIFQEKASSPELVAKQGLDILSYFPQSKDQPAPRIISAELIDHSFPWAFFDGASQENKCGGGALLFMGHSH